MMDPPLAGAFEKLQRAETHMRELERAFRVFMKTRPYAPDIQLYDEEFVQVEVPAPVVPCARNFHIRAGFMWKDEHMGLVPVLTRLKGTVKGRINGEMPALDFGVRIGDIVHNLRSALDNLTWALSIDRNGTRSARQALATHCVSFCSPGA